MIRKPFRTPLIRKAEESRDNEGDSEPQAKKSRISSDEHNDVKTTEPRLIFKNPGVSSLPRKPLLTVENSAVVTKPRVGFDGYYNALWYMNISDKRSDY